MAGVDLAALSDGELDRLTVDVLNELGRRGLQVRVAARLSEAGLVGLGVGILAELCRRAEAAPEEDKPRWSRAFEQALNQILPLHQNALRNQFQLFHVARRMLQEAEQLEADKARLAAAEGRRRPKPRKARRNEILHGWLTDPKAQMSFSDAYRCLLNNYPDLMRIKKQGAFVSETSLRKGYERWRRAQKTDAPGGPE